MELKEAQKVIHAGLAFANWTDEQSEAMREALRCMYQIEKIREDAKDLYEENIDLSDFGERVLDTI